MLMAMFGRIHILCFFHYQGHVDHVAFPEVFYEDYQEKEPEVAHDDASIYKFNLIIVYVNSLKIVF